MATPVWCPEQQIYVGGVPGASNEEVEELLESNEGCLYVFGYGSLCWNPGTDGALGHASVVATTGHAKGYRRAWAQKSTDHRGFVTFPGIVCTLLQQEEVQAILKAEGKPAASSTSTVVRTEGMIYKVPADLARDCLAELDFREKGGYAREIITVVQDSTGQEIRALLYRGTPDNPAFWPRVVWDLPLAAAVTAVSVGPSGPNDVYLNQLNHFLVETGDEEDRQDDTCQLAQMTKQLQQHELYFFYGCGSNQHGQLIIHYDWSQQKKQSLPSDQDFPQLSESVLWCEKKTGGDKVDPPQQLLAGGGHSGLWTQSGKLYLWGWNEQHQCGDTETATEGPMPLHKPLPIAVEKASLGFSHTLVIEKGTQKLFGMGDNSNGQILPEDTNKKTISALTPIYPNDMFLAVAAGVFHSAAITTEGELVTWGNAIHGQCLENGKRWTPPNDDSKLVQVVCGRHHTAVVDDRGKIWTFGDSKYGQLGRSVDKASQKKKKATVDAVPRLVDGPLGQNHDGSLRCIEIQSGWSHLVVRVESSSSSTTIYGWGRSDKGQLGCQEKAVVAPQRIDHPLVTQNISQISCGSEATYFLDQVQSTIYSCGWNEHGNLGVESSSDQVQEDIFQITPLADTARIVSPPTYSSGDASQLIMAAGGAHLLVLKKPK